MTDVKITDFISQQYGICYYKDDCINGITAGMTIELITLGGVRTSMQPVMNQYVNVAHI